jgi:hypothetical protein
MKPPGFVGAGVADGTICPKKPTRESHKGLPPTMLRSLPRLCPPVLHIYALDTRLVTEG